MPKVKVPSHVFKALSFVRDSGLVNMADINGVKNLVPLEVSMWIERNNAKYKEGFFFGFEAEEDN